MIVNKKYTKRFAVLCQKLTEPLELYIIFPEFPNKTARKSGIPQPFNCEMPRVRLLYIIEWVDSAAVFINLKMAMRAGGVSGAANKRNRLPLCNLLSGLYQQLAAMPI